jgi:hypothetical protein
MIYRTRGRLQRLFSDEGDFTYQIPRSCFLKAQTLDGRTITFANTVHRLAEELPHGLCRKRPAAGRCSLMDDTLQRNRWQELAEKASVEDNPARLMKLVDELLAELNRLKEKTRDSTRGSV